MPKWITTRCFTLTYGYKYDYNQETKWLTYSTHFDKLEKRLNEVQVWCDENQYIIKSVVPLTTANGRSGYEYGYGVSQITGFAVFAQKEEEISAEEFARRSKRQSLKKQETELKSKVAKHELPVAEDAKCNTEIIEKKIMLGGRRYHFGGKEFKSEEEARTEQAKLLSQITANKRALEKAQSELSLVQRELKELDLQ